MINPNKYCSQFDQLKAAYDENHSELVNRKCIIFHQDNTRPHVSLTTRQKLLQLGWEVLIHWLYSPDISSLDVHLLWFFQNPLNEKYFNPLKTAKGIWKSSLLSKIKSFGKMALQSCLKNVRS